MSKIKFFAAALCLAAGTLISAPLASAQDFLVVDISRVLTESKAGQDIAAKVRQIGESMQSELQPEQNALQTEKSALDAKIQGKTQEEVRADQALVAQGQAYSRKLQTFAAKSEKRSKELAATERAALSNFAGKLKDSVEKIRVEKGAQLVFAKSEVYLAADSIDVTDAVITQLDKDAPTIAVTRVTLPDQPARPAQ